LITCGKICVIRGDQGRKSGLAGDSAEKRKVCMRDALKHTDKIVSFTNGKLSYRNTLEHLNILDADYLFKLLDAHAAAAAFGCPS